MTKFTNSVDYSDLSQLSHVIFKKIWEDKLLSATVQMYRSVEADITGLAVTHSRVSKEHDLLIYSS